MNGGKRCLVIRGDVDSCAAGYLLQVPMNLILQPAHDRRARNGLTVNQHGDVEVSCGKHLGNVFEMPADLIAACGVPHVVGTNVNQAAIVVKLEVVSSLLMRESHL